MHVIRSVLLQCIATHRKPDCDISSAIPDPPFLQEDGYLPADMAAALMNGEAPPTNSSRDNSGMQVAVPQQTLLLTTDEDTLD